MLKPQALPYCLKELIVRLCTSNKAFEKHFFEVSYYADQASLVPKVNNLVFVT